jgi:hypothetical protein
VGASRKEQTVATVSVRYIGDPSGDPVEPILPKAFLSQRS